MDSPDTRSADTAQTHAPGIAAFDVDGTLTWADSFVVFLRFWAGRAGFAWRMAALAPAFAAYRLGWIGRDAAKAACVRMFFAGAALAQVERAGRAFALHIYPRIERPDAMARLAACRAGAGPVGFVSASLGIYLRPWAEHLGLDFVEATELEVADGRATGNLAGANCRGAEKARRLRARFGRPAARAWGDSPGDTEMLAEAAEGFMCAFSGGPRRPLLAMLRLLLDPATDRRRAPAGDGA